MNARRTVEPLASGRVAELRAAPLTYPLIGTERAAPAGHRQFERSARIGHGDENFRRASDLVLSWGLQLGAGLRPRASSPTVEPDAVCELRLGVVPLGLTAPCRVVAVYEDEHARGFAYGTLPGHPESGEELFLVEREPDGGVRLRIRAFSRPATRVARWSGPLGCLGQSLITERYLRAPLELTAD
ncbi:DUF1990 domain-containing protein [Speluncibacter jeojiensis]|uniref:DUF1990 domain-containing protein n=1 Tax=Speluncibacter jeojiensis TaxID=2710754 RepID=A0A9X4LXG5_9ACTN|nr:DUF1990 domain-containing protein [Corynebacteriales bacterium D3-21]